MLLALLFLRPSRPFCLPCLTLLVAVRCLRVGLPRRSGGLASPHQLLLLRRPALRRCLAAALPPRGRLPRLRASRRSSRSLLLQRNVWLHFAVGYLTGNATHLIWRPWILPRWRMWSRHCVSVAVSTSSYAMYRRRQITAALDYISIENACWTTWSRMLAVLMLQAMVIRGPVLLRCGRVQRQHAAARVSLTSRLRSVGRRRATVRRRASASAAKRGHRSLPPALVVPLSPFGAAS